MPLASPLSHPKLQIWFVSSPATTAAAGEPTSDRRRSYHPPPRPPPSSSLTPPWVLRYREPQTFASIRSFFFFFLFLIYDLARRRSVDFDRSVEFFWGKVELKRALLVSWLGDLGIECLDSFVVVLNSLPAWNLHSMLLPFFIWLGESNVGRCRPLCSFILI